MLANLEIKRVDLWSLFKIAFFIYAILGVIVGFITLFFSLIMGGLTSSFYEEEFPGMGLLSGAFGFFLIPFMAFLYGVIGSVFATICGAVFNFVSRLAGGLRIEIGDRESYQPVYPPPGPAQPQSPMSPPASNQGGDAGI